MGLSPYVGNGLNSGYAVKREANLHRGANGPTSVNKTFPKPVLRSGYDCPQKTGGDHGPVGVTCWLIFGPEYTLEQGPFDDLGQVVPVEDGRLGYFRYSIRDLWAGILRETGVVFSDQ